jgi:hypothetical protein
MSDLTQEFIDKVASGHVLVLKRDYDEMKSELATLRSKLAASEASNAERLRRPLLVTLQLVETIERDTGRRCGILMISPRDFRLLMSDVARHKDPIVRSGNGILLRGFRVCPEARLDVADMCFIAPTKDVEHDYCRN